MNGPDNYAAAEALLDDARTAYDAGDAEWSAFLLAEAEIRATLALAAATVHGNISDRVQSGSSWNGALS